MTDTPSQRKAPPKSIRTQGRWPWRAVTTSHLRPTDLGQKKLNILSFALASDARDSHTPVSDQGDCPPPLPALLTQDSMSRERRHMAGVTWEGGSVVLCCSLQSRCGLRTLSAFASLALLQHPFPSLAAVRRAPPQSMRQSRRSEGQPRARRRQRGCSPGRSALETSQWRPPLTAAAASQAGHASCCASRAIA